jgi:hypothetical protein
MSTVEERMRILKMVQDGKLTAEEAAQLINAVDSGKGPGQETGPEKPPVPGSPMAGRWFNVKISNQSDNRKRVNVRLPVSLVRAGIKMGAKFSPEVENLDVEELLQFINSGETGQFIEVFDEEDGDHIQVFID